VAICRVGFVGAGGVAARHARTLAGFGDVELVSVTDLDPARGREFAAEHRMRAVPDVAALVDSGVDAVYVCVPPGAHGLAEEHVIAAGLGLFVEKPVAVDLEVADRISRLITEAGVVSSVGHHWRYSEAVTVAQRALGERPARLVTGAWLDKVPPVTWWSDRAKSGGQAIEQAVHLLDLARLLAGEVAEVHAVAAGRPPEPPGADVDGATVANLRFVDGAVGALAATCVLGWKHRAALEVYADGLAVAVTENSVEVSEGPGAPLVRQIDPDAAKSASDRAFVDAVLGCGNDIVTSYGDALRSHRVACAVAESAASGEVVRIAGFSHGTR
jgi:myo-inositol 2-dehydrogenase/D-chiro-inositol 1-dehydrogenase